jgi:hypothetical protein
MMQIETESASTIAPVEGQTPDDEWYVEHVLPTGERGYIVISWTRGKPHWVDEAVPTAGDAIRVIRKAAADQSVTGVFASQGRMQAHARKKRSAKLALAFGSVWLDLDCKDFHRPGDRLNVVFTRILTRLKDFCTEVGLARQSAMVWSGGGIHAYWLFDKPVPKERWNKIAQALRAAVEHFGLPADIKCTTDAARVLRIPGTKNRKPDYDMPRSAEIIFPADKSAPIRYRPDDLEAALAMHVSAQPTPAVKSNVVRLDPKLFPPRPPISRTELSAGLEPDIEEIRSAVMSIPPPKLATEGDWMVVARALAHTACRYPTMAEDLWAVLDEASRRAEGYNEQDNRCRWERYIDEAGDRTNPITIATVFALARSAGWTGWRPAIVTSQVTGPAGVATIVSAPRGTRKPLRGGTYPPGDLLLLFNSHFLVDAGGTGMIFRIEDTGFLKALRKENFITATANIFVELPDQDDPTRVKRVEAGLWWLRQEGRRQQRIVFKPEGTSDPNEFNLWQGFAVIPTRGWSKQRRLLRHILEVLCRRDKAKFKYVMSWLAWAVQNTDKHAGTVIVLKSRVEGTGKSTLGVVMRDIFGPHGAIVDDKEQLTGKFNALLETKSLVVGEEILWANDRRTADKLKSRITSDTLPIEAKGVDTREVPNRLHLILTTNHDHAVAAGVRDRRFFVLDVSDERAQDQEWFGPLYRDLADGGTEQFLWFLQNLELGNWNPRDLPRTAESIEQQEFSADTIDQWSLECIEADQIVGAPPGLYTPCYPLGKFHAIDILYNAYCQRCRVVGHRAVNVRLFGKALTEMFGKSARPQAATAGGPRPRGYNVPDSDGWQKALDRRLGIERGGR